jgi:hypothetical protein
MIKTLILLIEQKINMHFAESFQKFYIKMIQDFILQKYLILLLDHINRFLILRKINLKLLIKKL